MIRSFRDLNFTTTPIIQASGLENREVTLNFFGDWAPNSGRQITEFQHESDYFPQELSNHLRRSDLNVFNLETTVSQNPIVSRGGRRRFRELPNSLEFLRHHNLNLASLANNHTMDFLEDGLKETLEQLNRFSLGHAGAGFDQDEIYQPHLFENRTVKIAIICVADGETGNEKFNNGVGTADVTSFRVIDQIRKSKDEGYFTIVFVHAGVEFLPYPPPFIQDLYRTFALQGADFVIGHHPHIIQGMEVYSGTPIFYSIGHFDVYRENSREEEKLGLLLSLKLFDCQLQKIELLPFRIEAEAIKLLDERELEVFQRKYKERSEWLNDRVVLNQLWSNYVYARQPVLDFNRALKLFKVDSHMFSHRLDTLLCSANMPFIWKEFQNNGPTPQNSHIDLIRNYRLTRKLFTQDRIFLAQKDIYQYPRLVAAKFFTLIRRICKYLKKSS